MPGINFKRNPYKRINIVLMFTEYYISLNKQPKLIVLETSNKVKARESKYFLLIPAKNMYIKI